MVLGVHSEVTSEADPRSVGGGSDRVSGQGEVGAAKRFKRVDRAIAVIWKMLMVAESRFRRLKALELGRHLQGWNRHRNGTGEGRRLISFTHLLT